ncbi:MAG: SIS domain-containing protein [Steroidobacterales bacterium]
MTTDDRRSRVIIDHFENHRQATEQSLPALKQQIQDTGAIIIDGLKRGRKVLAFGNGGSASQASHLAGELIGRYSRSRRPYPAIALVGDPGVLTCIANDFGYPALFERQVEALAQSGDLAIGFSTSGKSPNVLAGLAAARRQGAVTIALTGAAGLAAPEADHVLAVPCTTTAHIQEVHLMILHLWCELLELEGAA